MTKISPDVEVKMSMKVVLPVSADVSFASNSFPKYKLGADNQILEEPKEDDQGPLLKEVIQQEASHLSEQHKRLSVRDLASKFDKNLAAAAKLSNEVLVINTCLWSVNDSFSFHNVPKLFILCFVEHIRFICFSIQLVYLVYVHKMVVTDFKPHFSQFIHFLQFVINF